MKTLSLTFALSLLFAPQAEASNRFFDTRLTVAYICSCVGVVAGVVMLGVSTHPNGDFNQQQSCDAKKILVCCNNGGSASSCSPQQPSVQCPPGQTTACDAHGVLSATQWSLKPWAYGVQITGAVVLSVSGVIFGILSLGAISTMLAH